MNKFTTVGLVATTPRQVVTETGLEVVSFRLASTSDRERKADGETTQTTNWFTVSAYKNLAKNAGLSIDKGDRVIVSGDLVIRDWDNGERSGTAVEIEADVIAHDLNYGVTQYQRTPITTKPAHACDCQNCEVA
jgi:single-strand DNA-binding protein